jgi:branched-chain amino acid transport system permease protein
VPSSLPRAAAALLLVAVLLAVPHLLSLSQQEIAVLAVINVLLVASYRLLTLTGEWSLGHVVLMGVGGYASALLSKDLGVPVPLAMPLGATTAALVAWVLSFPLFRMKGFYFLIGSFAAGEVIRLLWIKFRLFGGPKGLTRIPPFPDVGPVSFFDAASYYYLALAVVGLSLLALWRIERSRLGLTFHAVHWSDKLAGSVGVDTRRVRTQALVIASFFAGLAGTLLAHYLGAVNPTRFDVAQMVFVLIWVIVGGTSRFYGPILGVVVLTALNEVVLRGIGAETMRPFLYGLVLVLTVLFLPGGLESLVERIRPRWRGVAAAPASSRTPV